VASRMTCSACRPWSHRPVGPRACRCALLVSAGQPRFGVRGCSLSCGRVRLGCHAVGHSPAGFVSTLGAVWHPLGLATPDRASPRAPPSTLPLADLVQLGVLGVVW
jgi:hypothetical protein